MAGAAADVDADVDVNGPLRSHSEEQQQQWFVLWVQDDYGTQSPEPEKDRDNEMLKG